MADTTAVSNLNFDPFPRDIGKLNSASSSSEPDTKEQCSFPVYLIHSKWSLPQLDNFLKDFGDVGFLRIVYDNEGKETDRTIAILPADVYESLCNEGYGEIKQSYRSYGRGFHIAPFYLRDNCFPGEGRTKTLFVPVPKDLGGDDSQVIGAVVDKLKHLSEWGIVEDNSWSVNVPLKSREKGGVKSGCFVSFKRDIPLNQIAMVRILLTDTYWPEHSDYCDRAVFRCFWARDRNERVERDTKRGKTQKPTAIEVKNTKEEKNKNAIQKIVKKAQPVSKKSPTVPVDSQPVTNNSPIVPIDSQSVTNNSPTVPIDSQSVTNNSPTVPIDSQSVTNNSPTVPIDFQSVTNNSPTVPVEKQNVLKVEKKVAPAKTAPAKTAPAKAASAKAASAKAQPVTKKSPTVTVPVPVSSQPVLKIEQKIAPAQEPRM